MITHLMRPLDESTYPEDAHQYAPAILAAWLKEFPESQPTPRDKEDWVENAVFLQAFKELGVAWEMPDRGPGGFVSASVDTITSNGTKQAFFHTGISRMDQARPLDYDLVAQKADVVAGNMLYGRSLAFQNLCGRKTVLAAPSTPAIERAIMEVIPEGGSVFIKTVKKESARTFVIDIDAHNEGTSSIMEQVQSQEEDFAYGYMHLEGSEAPYFLIQEAISPTFEYRMFMVGDEPVTGAGCVEEYTPLDNDTLFDTKVEELRNSGEIEKKPEIAEAYAEFAREFGKVYAEEVGMMNAYSLDLCIDADTGEIAIIELNPAMNLGRYASNVHAWVKAVEELSKKKA